MERYIDKYKEYPKELFKGRMETEALFIGCLMKDMLLLDDIKITKNDFATKDALFYFSILSKLRNKNINAITEIDIIANFNDKVIDKFNSMGGMKQANKMMDMIDTQNFDSYLDSLCKYNIIISLHDKKYNLLEPIEIEGKMRVPIDVFHHLDSEQIVDFYELQLNNLNVSNHKKGVEEIEMDITDEFIEDFLAGENSGVPIDEAGIDEFGDKIYAFPKLSGLIQGFIRGSLSMLGGYSSVGKSTMIIYMIMALIYRGEKVLIISNEQDKKPFMTNFLMWILTNKMKYYKLTKKNLLSGEVTDEDLEKIKMAQKIWRRDYAKKIYFVSLPNADMKVVKKKIREYHLTKGVTAYVYDTFKADFADDRGDSTWKELIKDSRVLFELAKKYDLIGIATIQLAMHTLGTLFLTPNVLSQSKQVVEILENLLLMRNVYPEELDAGDNRYYCKPYRYEKTSDGKWNEKRYDIDNNKQYRMLFIAKCRNGENSQSGNYAMLLNFDGGHGGVREYSLCHPRNAFINRG